MTRVTFKDLRKRVSLKTIHQNLYDRLNNKPFWIWDQQQHKKEDIETKGDCCFKRHSMISLDSITYRKITGIKLWIILGL